MIIHADHVGISLNDRWIFRKLEFQLQQAESLVLIGPSGTGKSVLLKLIADLLKPSEGHISVNCKELGMLFQKNALFDSLTVEENLTFPLKEKKKIIGIEAKKLSSDWLDRVGLTGTQNLYPNELSGGMQKRLGIARALILEPDLILYDEPTAGLDPITSRLIAQLIINMKATLGSTLVTVTNEISRAQQIGTRIHLMAEGKMSEAHTPETLLTTKNPVIHQFVFGMIDGPLKSGLT